MLKTVVPSLASQLETFDVQVLVQDFSHQRVIESATPFKPVLEFNFDGYDVQSRIDSDDIIFPGYVKAIHELYDGQPRVVTFSMKKFKWDTSETYLYGGSYHEGNCSMFSSLLSPPRGCNIYSVKHGDLHTIAPVTLISGDLCRLVIHADNKVSGISERDSLEV